MFTKADYLNYGCLLQEKEHAMVFGLQQLLEQVTDEAVARQLRALLREKQEAAEEVIRLFGKMFGMAPELRRYKREPALGEVKPSKRTDLPPKPETEMRVARAEGPGMGLTLWPAARAAATRTAPGSERPGVPASVQ